MRAIEEFEFRWSKFLGTDYTAACSSGTTALHLALLALDIGPGDQVIVPEFSMAAAAFAVKYTGATPVFVDCGDDLNIDPDLIEDAITDYTKAIIVVHIYGAPCDMDRIMEIADDHSLFVVEDCAEAHGALYKDRMVGTFGELSTFSFYKNKIFHAEEGGCVSTNNEWLDARVRKLKCMAFDDLHSYYHDEVGYNYRMTEDTANRLNEQLKRSDEIVAERRNLDGSVNWVWPEIFYTEKDRDDHMKPSYRPFFKPMSMLPPFRGHYKHLKAYDYSKRGLYKPFTT